MNIGYSGEDCPRSMIPSCLGVLEDAKAAKPRVSKNAENGDVEMEEESKKAAATSGSSIRYISGRTEIDRMRENMKV